MFWLLNKLMCRRRRRPQYPGVVGKKHLIRIAAFAGSEPYAYSSTHIFFVDGLVLYIVLGLLASFIVNMLYLAVAGIIYVFSDPSIDIVTGYSTAYLFLGAFGLVLLGRIIDHFYGPGAYLAKFPPERILEAREYKYDSRGFERNHDHPASLFWHGGQYKIVGNLIGAKVRPKDFEAYILVNDNETLTKMLKNPRFQAGV